jgi:uncharacterized protein YigE (DUF2233 family)
VRTASFPVSSVELSIEDVHMSTRLDDVLRDRSVDLAVNGGFFDERGEPIGLAVSEGKPLGRFAPGMSGGVFWIRGEDAHITATEEYRQPDVDFAVQCRPRLVVSSRVNIRSDDGKRASRTAICLRDGGKTIELALARGAHGDAGPTLLELAEELLATGCEDALNLDGGPSTGWAARSFVSLPAAPVRHALVVRPR